MAKMGYIQVTRKCNQKCIICSNPSNDRKAGLRALKKQVLDLKKNGFREIILTGGEPTLFDGLPELIEFCREKKIVPRIITNGQKIANKAYLEKLKKAGLDHLHLSIYSRRNDVQARLSQNKKSFANIKKALDNLQKIGGIHVDINITISKYNASHLSETVSWLVEKYGFLRHFVFNNLDPLMNKASENTDVIPRLDDFDWELHKSLELLNSLGKTFRVERVPLCYLSDFEYASTETRKIVKKEGRMIYFLDKRGKSNQKDWRYKKSPVCKVCSLNSVCAGLYAYGGYFDKKELYPVFVDKKEIIRKIIKSDAS